MSRKPRWSTPSIKNGVWEVTLSSWKYFHDYIRQEMLDYSHYIWRGQQKASWQLESSLDRIIKTKPKKQRNFYARKHLKQFKYAIRGRRGNHPSQIETDNDWWSLGQHHGLATPLLDWTESPFVALYFAFENNDPPSTEHKAVWALGGVTSKNRLITKEHKADDSPPILEFVRPLQDENSRLVNQSGLFTRAPLGETVDEWVDKNHLEERGAALIKLLIPNTDRLGCLRTLNRMNINHLTLFPDLYGASNHCNKALIISKY